MNNYVIIEKIGEGAYGAMYKAKCKATNKIVAIKKIQVQDGDEGIPATTIREAVHLVFEYMTMDLRALLDSHAMNRTFDDAGVKKYLGQIVGAILFCHQRRVLHHDLNPANVLVDRNGNLKVDRLRLVPCLYATSVPDERISAKHATTHPYLAGSRDCKRAAHSTEKEGQ
ncbi:hypothetical protein MRX96_006916 [Rhipicephalus microplus]